MTSRQKALLVGLLVLTNVLGLAMVAQRRASLARRNVVIFSTCSLRADRLGCLGSTRGLTPNIDRFARGATVYERAYTQGTWTRPSHYTLFTGRYPYATFDNRVLPEDETLAESLARAGYVTAAFVRHGNVAQDFGFNRGFEHFSEENTVHYSVPNALLWIDRDRDPQRPFFMFALNDDAHPPHFGLACPTSSTDPDAVFAHGLSRIPVYQAKILDGNLYPSDSFYKRLMTPGGRELLAAHPEVEGGKPLAAGVKTHLIEHYDASVREVDAAFGALVDGLEERGLLDSTVVVLIADHGWDLFDNGLFSHSHHGFDSIAHVPLVMAGPGVKAGARISTPVATMDVAPTILGLVGAPPNLRHEGFDLLDAAAPRNRPVFTIGLLMREHAHFFTHMRTSRYDLVHSELKPNPEVYDLEADPGEGSPIAVDPKAEPLASLLAAYAKEEPMLPSEPKLRMRQEALKRYASPVRVSPQTREYLQKNGYCPVPPPEKR